MYPCADVINPAKRADYLPEDECPDAPRYKACGNSMCVNCMEWLGRRIQMEEERIRMQNDANKQGHGTDSESRPEEPEYADYGREADVSSELGKQTIPMDSVAGSVDCKDDSDGEEK